MRTQLLYNPRLLIERLAEYSKDKRRFGKLKNTPASNLSLSQMASLEFLEMAKNEYKIKTLYDIGANAGTWTQLAKTILPGAEVHAFEPVPQYQEQFGLNTKDLKGVQLHRVATGEQTKTEQFNIAGHSSSFYEVSETLTSMFPSEKKTAELTVQMVKLDEYVSKENIPWPDVMKLDIEGYELQALSGAEQCMAHARYIIMEVSFIERHIGQPLFHDVINFMAKHNYFLCAFPVRMHLASRISMTDVLFERRK